MVKVDADRQLPDNGQLFLDHVGWFVHDMAVCAARFSALGFNLTPYSVHGDRNPESGEISPTGTANRLVMLDRGYLEFLVTIDGVDTPVTRHLNGHLDQHEGVHLAAFSVTDAEAEGARLRGEGFTIMPTVNLRRQVEMEDGSQREVAFTLIRPEFGSFPEGRIQSLVHHTPDEMWQGRYVKNSNGIRALDYVLFVSDAPAESARRLARFTGRRDDAMGDDGFEITLDRGRVMCLTRAAGETFLGGEAIAEGASVAAIGFKGDTATALEAAKAAGVGARRLADGRVIIPAEAAMGCCLVVSED